MRAGAITEEDRNFTETWENISPSTNTIIRLDRRGDEVHEVISGRRQFFVTTEERYVTQERILDEIHDPFKNGCFRPVVVPDSVSVDTNPNALSDDEIRSILVSSGLAWDEWLVVLTSPETLRRMLDLADESEISLKRYKQLATRLAEVKPKTRVVQKDQEQFDAMADSGNRAQRSGGGGRSADYRKP